MPEPLTDRISNPSILRERAERAAGALPPLLVAAERLASTIALGVHGRRKAGMGETFWSSAAIARRAQPAPSTGGNRPNRSICSCGSANGRQRRPCGSGAMLRPGCGFRPTTVSNAKSIARVCFRWRSRRCWCAAANALRCSVKDVCRRVGEPRLTGSATPLPKPSHQTMHCRPMRA